MAATIIVAAHGDEDSSLSAVALGVELARIHSAELALATLWVSPLGAGDGIFELVFREAIERDLEKLAQAVPADVPCRRICGETHSLMSGICHLAEEREASFIVFGPSHVSRGLGSLLGDRALGAAHAAAATVAVAPAGYRGRRHRTDVVVGWDDSRGARAAIEEGIVLARSTGGVLRIVCVLEYPYRYTDGFTSDPAALAAWTTESERWTNESLNDALQIVDGRVPATTARLDGQAGLRLAEVGREAAFILTGSSRHGALMRVVLGSTSASLLHHAKAPVIVMCKPSVVENGAAGESELGAQRHAA